MGDAVKVGRRHAEHYQVLVEHADRGQNEELERLQAETGNLAAVRWYLPHHLRPLPHLFRSCLFGRGATMSVRPCP